MKNLLFILLTLSFLFSCQETPEFRFEKDGISLISPKGWNLTDEENLNPGYYLSIEKDGFNSSGLTIIMWFDGALNRTDALNFYIDELSNQFIWSNFLTQNIIKNEFNGISSLSLTYTGNVFGLKHEGISHSFHSKGKTFFVAKQGAVEDRRDNEIGFRLIEKSFELK